MAYVNCILIQNWDICIIVVLNKQTIQETNQHHIIIIFFYLRTVHLLSG